ncbi:MAG: YihY/virulence factor BrkB family protein [Bacteroidia bacterium]|nr:YihY/virulence factor BrkB family protein [Bacteroidia bacterium]
MAKTILQKINSSKIVQNGIKISRKIVLPGFEGFPLYDVMIFFIRGLQKGAITTRASSLAFNFFLAIFPSIIFLFTLIPFVPVDNFQITLFELLREVMPKSAFDAAEDTIADIVKNQHGSLLSVGFISALYFSTNGVNAMIEGFNSTQHEMENRSWIKQRLIALLLVIITTLTLIVAIAIIIYSELILKQIPLGNYSYYFILFGRSIVIFLLFLIVIAFDYYLGPSHKRRSKFFSPGAIFSTILTLITSLGFAYYVNHFGQYNKLYGSIGTLIIVLLWIYFNSIVLLLGFELNASIHSARENKTGLLKTG